MEDTFLQSEQLFAKLSLVDFSAFLEKHSQNGYFAGDYFAVAGNSTEQFTTFIALIRWVFTQLDISAPGLSSHGDPLAICVTLVAELQARGLVGGEELVPQRLKTGWGTAVLQVLHALADRLLAARKVQLGQVTYPVPEPEPVAEGEDAEEESSRSSADELDHALAAEETAGALRGGGLETDVDEREWYAECERVAERLQTKREGDRNEWRFHIDINRHHCSNVEDHIGRLRHSLERVSETIEKQSERIRAAESFLNNALASALAEVQGSFERRQEHDARIKRLTVKIKELTDEFNSVNARCADIQKRLDVQNATATDDGPVIALRRTLDDLRAEMLKMDIHIGVLSSTVLNHNFRDKRAKIESAGRRADDDHFDLTDHQLEELV